MTGIQTSIAFTTLCENGEQLPDTLDRFSVGLYIPMSAKNQKEIFQTIVEETLGENCDFETVKSIHENLSELVEETKDEPAPPVLYKTIANSWKTMGGTGKTSGI